MAATKPPNRTVAVETIINPTRLVKVNSMAVIRSVIRSSSSRMSRLVAKANSIHVNVFQGVKAHGYAENIAKCRENTKGKTAYLKNPAMVVACSRSINVWQRQAFSRCRTARCFALAAEI